MNINNFLSNLIPVKTLELSTNIRFELFNRKCSTEYNFTTLKSALDKNELIISEISTSGTVPQLQCKSKTNKLILVLAGEEIIGAKQNRITNISFIVVPTPSSKNGSFSAKYANQVFSKISNILKKKKTYHLFVLVSTVLPGTSRNILIKKFIKNKISNFGYCYSPAFIALGQIIKDFLNPDFLLIGELDKRSGNLLKKFYNSIYKKKMNYRQMSLESAEIAKLSVNTYITNKISTI